MASTLRSFLFLLAAIALTGCATIHPPANPRDPTPISIADYGRHTSLILPDRRGELVEYAFGEWGWFAKENNWLIRIPGILLLPSPGTLGRREIPNAGSGLTLETLTGAPRVMTIQVAAADAAALSDRLESRFDAARTSLIHNTDYDMDFVRAPDRYWLFNSCNTTTADWLREAGCKVRGPALLSHFRLGKPVPTEPPSPPARSPAAGSAPPDPQAPVPSAG